MCVSGEVTCHELKRETAANSGTAFKLHRIKSSNNAANAFVGTEQSGGYSPVALNEYCSAILSTLNSTTIYFHVIIDTIYYLLFIWETKLNF